VKKIIDVPYTIKPSDPNITLGDDITAGSGDGETEATLFSFLCPTGLTAVFLEVSSLAAYLSDNEAAPAEVSAGQSVRIVHVDSAGNITVPRIDTTYESMKDFADKNKMKRFEDKFSVCEKEKLVCYVIPESAKSLAPSLSRFEIRCRRVSKLLSI